MPGIAMLIRSVLILAGREDLDSLTISATIRHGVKSAMILVLIRRGSRGPDVFGVIGMLMRALPVAFTLGGTPRLIFALIGMQYVSSITPTSRACSRYIGYMTNEVVVAAAIGSSSHGVMLERSRIAEQLLVTMASCRQPCVEVLGSPVVIVGALLSASTGRRGAAVGDHGSDLAAAAGPR